MFAQFLIDGFIAGILYSLLAIGFALVYNTTKVFHMAAAGMYVFAAFMFYFFAVVLQQPAFVAAVIAVVLTMGLSWLSDLSVYRPLKNRNASGNVIMIASIGMMTVVIYGLALIFGNSQKVIVSAIHKTFEFGGVKIAMPQMWQLVVGSLVIILFLVFMSLSDWGIRLRALSTEPVLYETLGYNTSRTRSFVFLLSGAFIGIASCLTAYDDTGLNTQMGVNVLVNPLAAMIIGGVGRFGTCVIGGITLGIIQAITVHLFSLDPQNEEQLLYWQNAVACVLLLILLFLRPQGIAGYKQRTI